MSWHYLNQCCQSKAEQSTGAILYLLGSLKIWHLLIDGVSQLKLLANDVNPKYGDIRPYTHTGLSISFRRTDIGL